MKVSDILRVKGNTLYTVTPDQPLARAIEVMAEKDIGSLVVMAQGELVGMLTFREVILALVKGHGSVAGVSVGDCLAQAPTICQPDTEIDQVRRLMLDHHARYIPVLESKVLMGVISFYDVAKAVVESQNFENTMLKAYIRDWPAEEAPGPA